MRPVSFITAATFYHVINFCARVTLLHACVVNCSPGETSDVHTGHAGVKPVMSIQRHARRDYGQSIIPGDTFALLGDRYQLMDTLASPAGEQWDPDGRSVLTGSQIISNGFISKNTLQRENIFQRENTLQRESIDKHGRAHTQNADGGKIKDGGVEPTSSLVGNVDNEIGEQQQLELRWRHTVHELTGERSRASTHPTSKVRDHSGMSGMPSVPRGETLSSDRSKGGNSDRLTREPDLGTERRMFKDEQPLGGRNSRHGRQRGLERWRRSNIDPSADLSAKSTTPELDTVPSPDNGIDSSVDQSGPTGMSGQLDPSLKRSDQAHYGNTSALNSVSVNVGGEGKMGTTIGDNEINGGSGYHDNNKVTAVAYGDSTTGPLDGTIKAEGHEMAATTAPPTGWVHDEINKGDNSTVVDNESTKTVKMGANFESSGPVTPDQLNGGTESIEHLADSTKTGAGKVPAETDISTTRQTESGSATVTDATVTETPVIEMPVTETPVIATSSSDSSSTGDDAHTSENLTQTPETTTTAQPDSGDKIDGSMPQEGRLVDTETTDHTSSSLDSVMLTETTTATTGETTTSADDVTTTFVPDDATTAIVPDGEAPENVPFIDVTFSSTDNSTFSYTTSPALDVTTSLPLTTSSSPAPTTTSPVTTMALPETTISPVTTMALPETTISPVTTMALPVTTTSPVTTTTSPVTTTTSPVATKASPVTSHSNTLSIQTEGETTFDLDYETDPSDGYVTPLPDHITPALTDSTTPPNSTQAPTPDPGLPVRAFDWAAAKQTWKYAWQIHIYTFGALFGLLALYTVVCVLRLSCVQRMLPRGYFLAVNVFMFLMCATRSFYMLYDSYNSENTLPTSLDLFLYSIAFPCLTSAFSLLLLSLLRSTNLQVMRPAIQNVVVLSFIIVIHFALSITADALASLYTGLKILQFASQAFFIIWGLALSAFFFYALIFRGLYSNAVKRQKNAAYGQAGEGWVHTTKTLTKYTFSTAVRVCFFIAICGLVIVGLEVYAIVDVYKTFTTGSPRPWPLWLFHTVLRAVEFLMALSLCYVASLPFSYRRSEEDTLSCAVLYSPCATIFCCGGSEVKPDAANRTSGFVDWHDSGHCYPGSKVSSLPKDNGYSMDRLDNKRLLKESIDSTPVVRKNPVAGSESSLLIIDNGVVRFQTDDDVADVINGYDSDHSDQKRQDDSHNMNTFQLREGYVNPYSLDDIRGLSSQDDIRGLSSQDDGGRDKSRKSSMTSSEFFRVPSSVSLADSMENELERAFESFKLDTSAETDDQQCLDTNVASGGNPEWGDRRISKELPGQGRNPMENSRSNFEHNSNDPYEQMERPGSPVDVSTPLIQRSVTDSASLNDSVGMQHSSRHDSDSMHSRDQEVDELIRSSSRRRPSEGQGYQAAFLTSLLKSREAGSKENIDV